MRSLMRMPGKATIAETQKRFVEIAYCVYRFGWQQSKEGKKPWNLRYFCKNIQEAHLKGKLLRDDDDGRGNVQVTAEKENP